MTIPRLICDARSQHMCYLTRSQFHHCDYYRDYYREIYNRNTEWNYMKYIIEFEKHPLSCLLH